MNRGTQRVEEWNTRQSVRFFFFMFGLALIVTGAVCITQGFHNKMKDLMYSGIAILPLGGLLSLGIACCCEPRYLPFTYTGGYD